MSWLWGGSGSSSGSGSGSDSSPGSGKKASSNKTKDDPTQNLDPSLRDFLSKETADKYSPTPTSEPTADDKYSDLVFASPPPRNDEKEGESTSSTPHVPPQSLFPDGRYAHLWANYQSQSDSVEASSTPQSKVLDVIEGFRFRQGAIGRAAMENCSEEHWVQSECFRSGSWSSVLRLCNDEGKVFNRCYLMQQKFLRALGYLSDFSRPASVEEDIQMHADRLYHRMLDQEAAVAAAKKEGRPAPNFAPLVSTVSETLSKDDWIERIKTTDWLKDKQREQLRRLEPKDGVIEMRAMEVDRDHAEILMQKIIDAKSPLNIEKLHSETSPKASSATR